MSGGLAVVTGATGGLGRAIARRLSGAGLRLALVDRDETDQLAHALQDEGSDARGFRCDLRDPAAIEALIAEVTDWGGDCTILVNNAGIFPTTPLERLDLPDWREVMAVNLDAPFLLSQGFAPAMLRSGWGRIINIASAVVTLPRRDTAAYQASKMGLIGLTRALASDLGRHGITVNALSPGLTRTEAVAAKFEAEGAMEIFERIAAGQAIPRSVVPADIAGAVAFLAGPEAAMISGQTLLVDGGMSRL